MKSPSTERAGEPPAEPGRVAGPCALVVFGASGDLAKRKLIPALCNLLRDHLLPPTFATIGVARTPMSTTQFRAQMKKDARAMTGGGIDPAAWRTLESRLYYVAGDFGDSQTFERVAAALADAEARHETGGNVLFYLSVGPDLFAPIVERLAALGLLEERDGRWRRVVVEKPFGRDLATARKLNEFLWKHLSESQIFRIDHYLGKDTVQNLLLFRIASGLFEPVWNNRYVDHVQITVAETLGVEGRGKTYESTGALRDMVPNHLFQLLSLTAMEPPISLDADAVRDEQVKVVRAIRPLTHEEVVNGAAVRGQYGAGTAGDVPLPDYRRERDVSPTSSVETFVALRLHVENWRWMDTPFYLRVGKAMKTRATEVVVQFKKPPMLRGLDIGDLQSNRLVIRIQPNESISLLFGAKVPGASMRLAPAEMGFAFAPRERTRPSTGYERLLRDAMLGNALLFQRADMVEAAWAVFDPILEVWGAIDPRGTFPNYAAGSWGPPAADKLLAPGGDVWHEAGT